MPDPSPPARWRTYLWSLPIWGLLSIPVDRSAADRHLELREATWWQVLALVVGMVGAAAASWLAAQYGPWSWFSPVRTFQRHAAMAFLGLATVAALYGVSLAFR